MRSLLLIVLAALSGHSVASTVPAVADEDLAALRQQYDKSGASTAERVRLVSRIAALNTEPAREFLQRECPRARPRALKRAVFDALRHECGPPAVQLVRQAVLDEDPYLRAHALELLSSQAPAEARTRARSILQFDEDARVRAVAVRWLSDGADEETARFVFETVADLTLEDQRVAVPALAGLPAAVFEASLGGDEPAWADLEGDPSRRLLGTLILSHRAAKHSRRLLTRLSRDPEPRVALAGALGLDRVAGREAGPATRRAMKRARDVDSRCQILQVVRRCGLQDPALTRVLLDELDHREWQVRAAAAEALATAAAPEAIEPLAELLHEDRAWQVRVACLRALGASARSEAVGVLIEVLERLEGRVAVEAVRALGSLTGLDFGLNAESWRSWWADHRQDFTPVPREVGQWAELAGPADRYAFYGIAVHSDRLAFVLDVSGSMAGGKLATLKKELARVIENLPERSWFNMVFFESRVHAWKDQLEPLKPALRKAALQEVRYREAQGGTDMWGGLMAAFADESVDTIYLLSDGQPTAGKVTNVAEICRRVTARNVHRRVAFHVVLIGYDSPHLRRLALESGGTYVEMR